MERKYMKKMIGALTALLVSVSVSMAAMGEWTDLGHFLKDAGQNEETDTDAGAGSGADAETSMNAGSDVDAETETGMNAGSIVDAEAEADMYTETETETETETDTETGGYRDEIVAKSSVENWYQIVVTDEENRPLEGVVIQFCDETSCTVGVTDSEGNVVFEAPEGTEYEVHVLQVPKEYEKTDEIFKTADRYGRVEIVLKQAK